MDRKQFLLSLFSFLLTPFLKLFDRPNLYGMATTLKPLQALPIRGELLELKVGMSGFTINPVTGANMTKRWHLDKYKMIKQKKLDRRNKPLGYYRKRKAMDCGNAQCYICSSEKLLDIPSINDIKSDINYAEQISEYWAEHREK